MVRWASGKLSAEAVLALLNEESSLIPATHMNMARDVKVDLTEYLRELHLPAIRQCFEEKARQAARETLSYEQYLSDLAERECQDRRENRIARLLRESRLPLEKTMENFDLKRLPAKAARQVKALLDGAFLDRKENVLAFGNPDPETFCTCLLHH